MRISLGGVRDEAEIRGHRRTYIGALPGQIIQGLRRAGSRNPVFMLDEIDKLGADFRGDPASALLEVLDPEQNFAFRDHYLDVPFDLSEVLFITTANVLDPIPPALRDRMEVIELAGYTEEEKLQIAREHLVAKQVAEPRPDRGAVDLHGRGDRHGDPRLHARGRRPQPRARDRRPVPQGGAAAGRGRRDGGDADPRDGARRCSAPRASSTRKSHERTAKPGVAIGLAWTPVGGDILFVEATRMHGGATLTLTGQLGDVMKESAQAALSCVRRNADRLGLDADFFKSGGHPRPRPGRRDPEGRSVGGRHHRDGAGVAADRPPIRGDIAMTGEITLRGKVLPVGGIKEKVLAAHRAGVRRVILPRQNEKSVLEDIGEDLRKDLTIHLVSTIDEVIDLALTPAATPVIDAVPEPVH